MIATLALRPQTSAASALTTCADGLFDILQASAAVFERRKSRLIPAAALFAKPRLEVAANHSDSGHPSKRYFFKMNSTKSGEKHLFIVGKIIGRR